MAKKKKKKKNTLQERLIGERIRAVAIVHLTRRPEIKIHEETKDVGIDLLAFIMPEERAGVRQFGVELKGIWESVTAPEANRVLRPTMEEITRQGPFPFPVILFFFTMEKNQAWYTWVVEPIVLTEGLATLRLNNEAHCRPLDDHVVDEIVDQVNAWYNAYYSQVGGLVSATT